LRLIQDLREAGVAVEYSLTPLKSEKQFKRALELKARFTARLENPQAQPATVRLKNLHDRTETVLASDALLPAIAPVSPR